MAPEPNPGPPDLFEGFVPASLLARASDDGAGPLVRRAMHYSNFMMDPSQLPGIVEALGCRWPEVDAFASPHNSLFPKFWGPSVDAFSQNWRGESPLWINPPFWALPAVLKHASTLGAMAIVILLNCHHRSPLSAPWCMAGNSAFPRGAPTLRAGL